MARRKSFSDEIRAAVKASPLTMYKIAQHLDVDRSMLSRFMVGRCGLSLATLDSLAELLDLHVTAGKAPAKGAK